MLEDPLALLDDHAHLEKKAAANALELLNRSPEPAPPENWVTAMTGIAGDEVEHLATVCRLLARRGGRLTKSHSNPYASQLHDRVRRGRGTEDLGDRLLVSSLIEARSCDRFQFLGTARAEDSEIARMYRALWASEHGHYLNFLHLAEQLRPREQVSARWSEMLDEKAKVCQSQQPGSRMHSGLAAE